MPNDTVSERWRKYKQTVYPQGVSGIQAEETRQAFFAGASTAMQMLGELARSNLAGKEREDAAAELGAEVDAILRTRLSILEARARRN